MNYKKFFALALEAGIEQSQLYISKSKSFSIKLFHHEIDSYKVAENQSVVATGIYNGKFITASSEKLDGDCFDYLIKQMKISAEFTEKPAEVDLFPGSPKYKKGYVVNPILETIPAKDKLAMLHRLEDGIYAADPRVTDADAVSYSESYEESVMLNSLGLKLQSKSNSFSFVAGAVVREGEETKTYYDIFFDNDFSKFDPDAFATSIVKQALSKLGGKSIKAKQYPTVIHRDIMSSLVSVLIDATSAYNVQHHTSFLEGKLGQLIASKKLTITENPFAKNLFYYYFDDEGVAAKKKDIIKNGVLQTYLHNRETAKLDGVESTGNANLAGRTMRVGYVNVFVKPGKQTFEEMIAPIKNGVFITEVAGLGSGLNPVSGDFSCQAEGFRIVDGKVAEPLNLITLSGNILKMFNDLRCFDNNAPMNPSGVSIGDAFIKKMNIGGL